MNREYLIIPSMAAPNGPLHLGHIAGPFLRADVLRRVLLREGAEAYVAFGTNPFDSFVAAQAAREGVSLQAAATRYHGLITEDLELYDIETICSVNPLDHLWVGSFRSFHVGLVDSLRGRPSLVCAHEEFPYSEGERRFVAPGALPSQCPDCGASVGGYFCEDCGSHLAPHELKRPARQGDVQLRRVEVLYTEPPDPGWLLKDLSSKVPEFVYPIVERHVDKGRIRVRLTDPSPWGLEYGGGTSSDASRFRLYGDGLLFAYCLLLGDVYRQRLSREVNPFDAKSDCKTINVFGIDNTLSHVWSIQALANETEGYKGFDEFAVNRFYMLEGRKFSTSRREVIWARDLRRRCGIPADTARLCLALTAPGDAETNFSVESFVQVYNDLGIRLNNLLGQCGERVEPTDALTASGGLIEAFHRQLALQRAAGTPTRLSLAGIARSICEWVDAGAQLCVDESGRYWWRACFALLAYPVMPAIAVRLWATCGFEGHPTVQAVSAWRARQARPDSMPTFTAVDRAAVEACRAAPSI